MNISTTLDEKMPQRQTDATPRRARRFALALLAIGTVLLLFGGTVTDYAHGLFAPDGIYIPNPMHRFIGEKSGGGALSHEFRIYNLRPRFLSVEVDSDCGCTGVSWRKATIAPFGWRNLTAKMESRKQKQEQQERSVGIAFRTNSRAKPFVWAFLVQ